MNSRRLRCIVVEVTESQCTPRLERMPKPSELVPWADPYIAQLVHQLQDEVRASVEKANKKRPNRAKTLVRRIKNLPK